MEKKQTRDFLIRNMPIKIYHLLEKVAKKHFRSKTQEAIVTIANGLSIYGYQLKKPIPFKWNKKLLINLLKRLLKKIENDYR